MALWDSPTDFTSMELLEDGLVGASQVMTPIDIIESVNEDADDVPLLNSEGNSSASSAGGFTYDVDITPPVVQTSEKTTACDMDALFAKPGAVLSPQAQQSSTFAVSSPDDTGDASGRDTAVLPRGAFLSTTSTLVPRRTVQSMGEVEGYDTMEFDLSAAARQTNSLLLSVTAKVIYDEEEWAAHDGQVFSELPDMPVDGDAAYYFSDSFMARAMAAHDTHVAMPRRDFEETHRASRMEARRRRRQGRRASMFESDVNSPLHSASNRGDGSQSPANVASPTSARSRRVSTIRRTVSRNSSSGASSASADSMDEWRKTIVVPPRTPSPSPAAALPTLVVPPSALSAHPAPPQDDQGRRFRLASSLPPVGAPCNEAIVDPTNLLLDHRLLAFVSHVDRQHLLTRGIVTKRIFNAGFTLCREGSESVATHMLIVIRGVVEMRRQGALVGEVGGSGATLLEEECSEAHHRSVVTLTVGSAGLEAWCVPRVAFQRIQALKHSQRARAMPRAVPSTPRSDAVSATV
jgi:hypothetical protein